MKKILITAIKTIGIFMIFLLSAFIIALFPKTMFVLAILSFIFMFVWQTEKYKE